MKIFQKHLPSLAKFTLILCLAMLLGPIQSQAKDVTFEWTANSEPVTGYKLFYKVGENSGSPYEGVGANEGNSPILVGNSTSYTVTGLADDETYHFVLTAYNEAGESAYSAVATVDQNQSTAPVIINISLR